MSEPLDRHLEIVRLLADGQLHSGELIAARLGVSRAAVWKALRKTAETLELEIDAVRGHGYRLRQPLELLDQQRIERSLSAAARRRLDRLEVLGTVDSTNSRLMRCARDGSSGALACVAERQTGGRGRRGRRWVSPFGTNVYLSLLWHFSSSPAELGGLSLAAGVAVAQALAATGAEGLGLKWPNDVHWRRRKLAGLLLEVVGESQGPSQVVVGVGVNLRLSPRRAAAIDQPWTDLATVLGRGRCDRHAVVVALIEALSAALDRYGAFGLSPFLPDWHRLDSYRGEAVELQAGGRRIVGTHAGIDPNGALLLEIDGERRAFHAGEVSLRCGRA